MPHLRLADVQRLGQTCRAARALVDGLPEAVLLQLAQAQSKPSGLPGLQAGSVEHLARAQEAQLPQPKVSMRQQLDLWASQAAAVRAGGLHLGCKLGSLQDRNHAALSPHADQVGGMPQQPC